MQRIGLFALVVLLCFVSVRQGYGQSGCPFTEDDAVADTLDPKGYLPLEIGILREYVTYEGSFLSSLGRQEVIADTLIDGDLFYKLKVTFFDAQHTTIITEAHTSYHYQGMIDGVLYSWTPQAGKVQSELQFFRDFNTCYTHAQYPDGIVVEGTYDTTYFRSGESFNLASTKQFRFIITQSSASQEYVDMD